MRIESGTTTEHRVRLGIFLGMCVVFAAYFAYDGFWGYPAKNLEWARQNINVPAELKANLQTNPKVLTAELRKIQPGMTEAEVEALLGKPAVVVEGEGLFAAKDHWYVGPAACARITLADGKVRDEVKPLENIQKSESDIQLQKILGAILGVVSIGVGIYYIRINTMKTVVDDTGLTSKGRHVSWDAMTGLDTSDYDRKGWLDLVYRDADGREDTVGLDSYHIARFDEIIGAVCERKGFESPLRARQAEVAEA
ncbi:MAG TPA: hypothetical protein PLV57_20320 [Phycisphaerae bacterium]|nr:hypothetical protein [Phycisphaerae bacterium]HOM53553.1 hypothetical protein [Phycisphaerae bacterium]HPP28859.1 hypothetical protein [Phycisphaerae bacterium]